MMNPCQICGDCRWDEQYKGPVRDGRFESGTSIHGLVSRCVKCGVARLEGAPIDYSGPAYRESVDGDSGLAGYSRLHDASLAELLRAVGSGGLLGAQVVDVGCGAGRFLDVMKGLTGGATLGVEPAMQYRARLLSQGHEACSFAGEASGWIGKADLVTCFSTIEHVEDPVGLLIDCLSFLRPGGRFIVTTPNRADVLLELLPDSYGAFFYRRVHRWYFDAGSLAFAARRCGLEVHRIASFHRFDLSNLLVWLRERRPGGSGRHSFPPALEAAYRASLDQEGRGDYLFAEFRRPS